MTLTPKRDVQELATNQDGTTVYNSGVRRLEQSSSMFNVVNVALTTPPGSPSDGDSYYSPVGATGDWSSGQNKIAYYENGAWQFIPLVDGDLVWDQFTQAYFRYSGSAGKLQRASRRTFTATIKNPTSSESYTFGYLPEVMDVAEVRAYVGSGGASSVTWNIRYDTNRGGTGSIINSSDYTTTGPGQTVDSTPTVTQIPAFSYLWVDTNATTGTPLELFVCLTLLAGGA